MRLYFWWVNTTHAIIRKLYGVTENLEKNSTLISPKQKKKS